MCVLTPYFVLFVSPACFKHYYFDCINRLLTKLVSTEFYI